MDTFYIKYKRSRSLFWNREKIRGYRYDTQLDRMSLFYPDGSICEVAKWSEVTCFLGTDWVEATKKKMEKESGLTVPLSDK